MNLDTTALAVVALVAADDPDGALTLAADWEAQHPGTTPALAVRTVQATITAAIAVVASHGIDLEQHRFVAGVRTAINNLNDA